MTTWKKGDRVTLLDAPPRFAGVWTVEKVNPKNLILTQGGTRRVNAPKVACVKAADLDAVPEVTEIALPPVFDVGETVTVKGKPGVWVVINQGDVNVSVAPLGGNDGRYMRCGPSYLTRVTLVGFEVKEA
jgi:hypothetical protein